MKGRAARILLIVVSSVLFLAGLEGLGRIWEARRPPSPPEDYPSERELRSNLNGWPPWEEFNADGLRDRSHPAEKPAGLARWVFLGDSVTLGDHIQPGEAYPQVLQSLFDEEGRPVEVFNVALWGWSTRQQRTAYTRIVRRYRPDRVDLAVCLDDIPELRNTLAGPPRWLAPLHERSALIRLVNTTGGDIQSVEQLFSQPDARKVKDAFARFFGEVRAVRDAVERDGAAFGILVLPFRFQVVPGAPPPVVQERIAAFCTAERMQCLDLLPVLQPLGESAFVDDDHLSPRGARQVAAQILAVARPRFPSFREALESSPRRDPILLLASSDRAEARAAAAWMLGRTPAPGGGAALTKALRDPDESVRREAARALGKQGAIEPESRRDLYRVLEDPRESVRWAAARALFDLKTGAADVPRLTDALASRDAYVRGFAAFSLGKLGTQAREAAPALARALADPNEHVRVHAARALGLIDPGPQALAALEQAAQDTVPAVREEARGALLQIRGEAAPASPGS